MSDDPGLDPGQLGLGDMDAEAFRAHGHRVIDWVADYLEGVGDRQVLATVEPGQVRASLPSAPPSGPEPFEHALRDVDDLLLPGITHWNHPAFHAYFAITGSGPGILGETLAAALNVNGMLWRTSPTATELEELVLDWLRQLLGLAQGWHGVICDTASMSTMLALAAARERTDLDVRQRGLAGRPDVPMLRVYASEHAHSSVEKACIALGLGRDAVRTIEVDERYRMDAVALAEALREDARFGYRPMAIVPTVGTTSTTSVDPVRAVADVRDELVEELGHDVWLHVDGAYGGMLAICEEFRHVLDGVDRADSFVTNPHKWLFTPIDCSALFIRDPSALTTAFSLVPEYLTTDDDEVTDYMDWGVQLGRRFRALKLWLVLRYFGADGLAARIRHHVHQARRVADWVDRHEDLELAAPVPMSTVCFRAVPRWLDLPGPAVPPDGDPRLDVDTTLDPDTDTTLGPDAGTNAGTDVGSGDPDRDSAEDAAIADLLDPDPEEVARARDAAHQAEREEALSQLNRRLLARINATGRAYLSHTVLGDRYVLRLATGNLRTTDDRLEETLALIDRELDELRN